MNSNSIQRQTQYIL